MHRLVYTKLSLCRHVLSLYINVLYFSCIYKVAKTHRMPYLYSLFSAKEPYD